MNNYFIVAFLLLFGLILTIILVKIVKVFVSKLFGNVQELYRQIIFSMVSWIFVLLYFIYANISIQSFISFDDKVRDIVSKSFISFYVIILSIIFTKFFSSLIIPNLSERIKISSGENVSFSVTIFSNIAGLIFLLVGIGIILAIWNVSLIPLITTLGIGGLAVAIALQDTLANFFAGIQVLLVHQIRVGDYIKLENGDEGTVVDINWRNTTIKDLFNNIIIVPNSKLIGGIVKNFHLPDKEVSVVVPVQISIDNNLELVEKITVEIAKSVQVSVDGAVKDWEPLIRYREFDDYSIRFNVILRVEEYTFQFPVRHEFLKRLHTRFLEEGIKLPLPIIKVKDIKN